MVQPAQRLRREAVAMARLAHPNVVTVFEVGDLATRAPWLGRAGLG